LDVRTTRRVVHGVAASRSFDRGQGLRIEWNVGPATRRQVLDRLEDLTEPLGEVNGISPLRRGIAAFRFFSRLSISVALAGKIAGNARKRPPMPRPYFLAIRPATTVAKPPNKNCTAYSCGFVSFREDQLISIPFMPVAPKSTKVRATRRTRSAEGRRVRQGGLA
jgi:hypothetical protein